MYSLARNAMELFMFCTQPHEEPTAQENMNVQQNRCSFDFFSSFCSVAWQMFIAKIIG